MKTPPEAYLIFKEELKKAALEKEKLRKEYESRFEVMNTELLYLKEQILAQQQMMKTTITYATRLEDELSTLQKKINQDLVQTKGSFH